MTKQVDLVFDDPIAAPGVGNFHDGFVVTRTQAVADPPAPLFVEGDWRAIPDQPMTEDPMTTGMNIGTLDGVNAYLPGPTSWEILDGALSANLDSRTNAAWTVEGQGTRVAGCLIIAEVESQKDSNAVTVDFGIGSTVHVNVGFDGSAIDGRLRMQTGTQGQSKRLPAIDVLQPFRTAIIIGGYNASDQWITSKDDDPTQFTRGGMLFVQQSGVANGEWSFVGADLYDSNNAFGRCIFKAFEQLPHTCKLYWIRATQMDSPDLDIIDLLVPDSQALKPIDGAAFTHPVLFTINCDFATQATTETAYFQFREQDANNCWQVGYFGSSNCVLNEVIDGTPTQRGSTSASRIGEIPFSVQVIGTAIQAWITRDSPGIEYTSASTFQAETQGRVVDTSNYFDNYGIWEFSSARYSAALNKYVPADPPVPLTITGSSGADKNWQLDVSEEIYQDDVITLDYDDTNIITKAGGIVLPFADQVVVNNSTVTDPLLVHDTFTDTNGVLLSNHTPDYDALGGGWIELVSGWSINANKAETTTLSSAVVIDVGVSDASIESNYFMPVGAPSTDVLYQMTRVVDATHFYGARMDLDETLLKVAELAGGAPVIRASASHVFIEGELIKTSIVGTTVTVTAGSDSAEYDLATAGQTETRFGMRGYPSSATAQQMDNLIIRDLT